MGVSEILEERQGQKEIQSWQDATEKFLRSEDGADWPGTEANKITLGKILQELQNPEGVPLVELPDRQEAITLAWNYMKEHPELIKENPEIVQAQRLAKATSRAEIDEILGGHSDRARFGIRDERGSWRKSWTQNSISS